MFELHRIKNFGISKNGKYYELRKYYQVSMFNWKDFYEHDMILDYDPAMAEDIKNSWVEKSVKLNNLNEFMLPKPIPFVRRLRMNLHRHSKSSHYGLKGKYIFKYIENLSKIFSNVIFCEFSFSKDGPYTRWELDDGFRLDNYDKGGLLDAISSFNCKELHLKWSSFFGKCQNWTLNELRKDFCKQITSLKFEECNFCSLEKKKDDSEPSYCIDTTKWSNLKHLEFVKCTFGEGSLEYIYCEYPGEEREGWDIMHVTNDCTLFSSKLESLKSLKFWTVRFSDNCTIFLKIAAKCPSLEKLVVKFIKDMARDEEYGVNYGTASNLVSSLFNESIFEELFNSLKKLKCFQLIMPDRYMIEFKDHTPLKHLIKHLEKRENVKQIQLCCGNLVHRSEIHFEEFNKSGFLTCDKCGRCSNGSCNKKFKLFKERVMCLYCDKGWCEKCVNEKAVFCTCFKKSGRKRTLYRCSDECEKDFWKIKGKVNCYCAIREFKEFEKWQE